MYMLDTNICIYVLKNHSDRLRHKFRATKDLCISTVTYAELCFEIENGDAAASKARWEQLELFCRLLSVLPLDERAGHRYGRIRAQLKKQGQPIGNNDLSIAAHALSIGAVLVTSNEREFRRVPELQVQNWTQA